MKKFYKYTYTNRRIVLIILFSLLLIRILLKPNTILPFILLTNELVIQLVVITIMVLILIILIFKKDNLNNIISIENILSVMGIFVALVLFMSPSAYDKLEKFQNLQYITYLNCEHANFISQQNIETLPSQLLKQFNYDIYNQNMAIIINNFSSSTLHASQDSIRDMSISNNIIEKIRDYTIQNNFITTQQIDILSDTLINKSKNIASTTCNTLKPGIDETLRNHVDRSTFSVIIEIFIHFLKMVL